MNVAVKKTPHITFDQYLSGDFDCPWSDCLWVEGELIPVPPEYGQNNEIARYLFLQFTLYAMKQGLGWGTCIKDTDIEVKSSKHRTRKPDVMILSPELKALLWNRSAVITQDMEPPLLIVEVISKNYRTVDLVDKQQEYLDRQVPEYWTVDWDRSDPQIIVRTLDDTATRYLAQTYYRQDIVPSALMPILNLKVEDIVEPI